MRIPFAYNIWEFHFFELLLYSKSAADGEKRREETDLRTDCHHGSGSHCAVLASNGIAFYA